MAGSRLRSLAAALAGMLVGFTVPEVASATTYTVNDASDVADAAPGDGVCDATGPAGCTLRAAVETAANASSSGDDLIELPFDVSIALGELATTGNGALTIRGTGGGRRAIDAGDSSRVLSATGVPVTLEHLVLRNGRADEALEYQGGAVAYTGSDPSHLLRLDDSRVEDSEAMPPGAVQSQGGGVFVNGGALELTGSEVSGNTAGDGDSSGVGGGVYVVTASPDVSLTDSSISDNAALGGPPGARGGGLFVVNSGGVSPFGSVTLDSSTVSGNRAGGDGTATTGTGGGIYVAGSPDAAPSLVVTGGQIQDNIAGGGSGDAQGMGGGIAANDGGGGISLDGVSVMGNRAGGADTIADGTGPGSGGGVLTRSPLEATNTTFQDNRAGVTSAGDAGGLGGGVAMEGPSAIELTLTGSEFEGNSAGTGASATGHGGAVENTSPGAMEITATSFLNNHSRGLGGAVDRFRDTVLGAADTITDSRFSGNTSRADGAGLHSASNRPLTISGSEFSLNTTTGEANARGGGLALGAITAPADPLITIRNTTISGNAANGATSVGGGLALGTFFASVPTDAQLTHVTFAGNSAGASGGNLRVAGDGADDPVVRIRGAVVADGGAPAQADCEFLNGVDLDYASEGGNVEDGTGCDFVNVAMGDEQSADPLLAPLAANGGAAPTRQTHAISSGPAIDNVPPALCAGTTADQRGYPRPSLPGSPCDSGAYELFVCNGSPLNQAGVFPGCTSPPPAGTPVTPAKKKKCKKARKLKKGKCVKKKRKKKKRK